MKKRSASQSQLIDLLLSVSAELGLTEDRDLANLAGVSVETVANWRTGAVQELKPQKLAAVKRGLAARIAALREAAGTERSRLGHGLCPLEIEDGSGPADLQRQFRDRVIYHYLGHRFLYFDPQGALAWEMLIRSGYDQDRWVRGVESCAESWLDTERGPRGRFKGPLAQAFGLDRPGHAKGLDVISLGPGEGGKEVVVMERLLAAQQRAGQRLPWIAVALVDVSIPLLLKAARACMEAVERAPDPFGEHAAVYPLCADFEEGDQRFALRLPTATQPDVEGTRLVLVLGNVFGNVRDEESFVRQRIWPLARPGDHVWIEVGLTPERAEDEPLLRLTQPDYEETAADASRRLLLTGPYRRWEASVGRPPAELGMRVWVRRDDETCRVPRSMNFCHDIQIKEEGRAVTMLYSRRYELESLTSWLGEMGFHVERIVRVEDSRHRPRVAHLLLRRA